MSDAGLSKRGQWVSSINDSPAAAAAPTLSFTVPTGCVFIGVISQFSEAAGANNVGVVRLINNTTSGYACFLGYQGAATIAEKYPANLLVELPAGVYTSDWVKAAAGVTNSVSIIGNCYRI